MQKIKDVIVLIIMFVVVLVAAMSFMVASVSTDSPPQHKATAYLIVSLFLVFQLFILWIVYISTFRH